MRTPFDADPPISDPAVAAAFAPYDQVIRAELQGLRRLILATAVETSGVGTLEESLKWNQPSYRTTETGSGSTIRIAPTGIGHSGSAGSGGYAMLCTCHTTLVGSFRDLFGDVFTYDGNRVLAFTVGTPRPEAELRACVAMALTYRLRAGA